MTKNPAHPKVNTLTGSLMSVAQKRKELTEEIKKSAW